MSRAHCPASVLLAAAIYLGPILLLACSGGIAAASDLALELARAQQKYDEGDYLHAADILKTLSPPAAEQPATPEIIAASRLLAQVYDRSADYQSAAAVVELYTQLSPRPDAEMLLIAANSNLALGHIEEARKQLDKVSPLLNKAPTNTAQLTRLVVEQQRIAEALERAAGQPISTQRVPLNSTNLTHEERFDIVKLKANRYSDVNNLAEAIQLLNHEIATQTYDLSESAELKQLLADCYRRQASAYEESGNVAARATAMSAEDHALASLEKDLISEREKSSTADDFLKLLPREGLLHERKAELAHAAAQNKQNESAVTSDHTQHPDTLELQHLQAAAKCYQALATQVSNPDRATGRDLKSSRLAEDSRPANVNRYRDIALCGLQRVFEALRYSSDSKANVAFTHELLQVSDQLVAERSQRLLPTDPALYDAKCAQASVYASVDELASHTRATQIYRDLVAVCNANPSPQRQLQAAALIGLAEMLHAFDKNQEAYRTALQANATIDKLPRNNDALSQRDRALLVARINNSLGVTSIALGEYRDAFNYLTAADQELKPYGDRFGDLRRQNEQALLILSRVEVYRALLDKAEAKYTEAGTSVRESRKLREQIGDHGDDILAYHLAEASIRLAQARDLMQQHRASNQDPSVRGALDEAEHALDRAQPMCEVAPIPGDPHKSSAALPYRYLRALLVRLRGNSDSAAKSFLELSQNCEQQNDMKTAAKCYMQLAELTLEALAHSQIKLADSDSSGPEGTSRMRAVELRKSKLNRYSEVTRAADYADRAVGIFSQMGAPPEDETAVTALPSLHFQAAYLDARLQITLAALENHIARIDELLAASAANGANSESMSSHKPHSVNYRQRAIELLEDAVHQAERPASSTTEVRLQRARFFSRYAPAYDMLVDLYVASAVGQAETATLDQSSPSFANMRRAIEIADLARNRTFREQIDGWRQAAGAEVNAVSFDWNKDVSKLIDSNTALLIYHLDGPQLLDLGASRAGRDDAPVGGGHLFALLEGGSQIQYFRLHYKSPSATNSVSLSRELAVQLVRRQLGWIENPDTTRDWGRAEQRALTECLLPQQLLSHLVASPVPHSIRHLVIITDGALHQLPFESLLMPESKEPSDRRVHYVIDDLPPLRYGPSLSVLAEIADSKSNQKQSTEQLLTVGNPAYPTDERQRAIPSWQELLRQMPTDGGHFVPLTHSEDESNAVFASFSELPPTGRTRLLQAAATEAEVRKHISNAQLIHIAAHGCVDYQNDNLCGGLVLTPGSDPKDTLNDGLLQLREIYSLDLSHCDLAVLSACQTFVGPERPLEAGTSMARAFLEQGARRVICSQWSTDDRATTDLMKSFFDALQSARREGKAIDYAAALHDAKVALRRDSERGSMPKYWAAFVLVGAP